jgi:hypothetical protein
VAELTLIRTLGGFQPADISKEAMKKFEIGLTYKAKITRPRSLKALARYWVLVQMILDNTDQFKSKEQLHSYLKIRAGHCTPIVAKSTGEVFLIADSIDFDTLDEGECEWLEIWKRIVDVVCADILPGIGAVELELEIQKLLGIAR